MVKPQKKIKKEINSLRELKKLNRAEKIKKEKELLPVLRKSFLERERKAMKGEIKWFNDLLIAYIKRIQVNYRILSEKEEKNLFNKIQPMLELSKNLGLEDNLITLNELTKKPLTFHGKKIKLNAKQKKLVIDGLNAWSTLILHNLRLAFKYARQFHKKHKSMSLSDFIQEATLGMINAIKRFNPKKYPNTLFTTYAFYWVKSYINLFIAKHKHVFSISPNIIKNIIVAKTIFDSMHAFERTPSQAEIQKELESVFSKYQLKMIKQTQAAMQSAYLEQEAFSVVDSKLLKELIFARTKSPEALLIEKEKKEELMNAVNELEPRLKFILEERFFLGKPTQLRALAKKLNISFERVRQLEQEALIQLRKKLLKSKSFEVHEPTKKIKKSSFKEIKIQKRTTIEKINLFKKLGLPQNLINNYLMLSIDLIEKYLPFIIKSGFAPYLTGSFLRYPSRRAKLITSINSFLEWKKTKGKTKINFNGFHSSAFNFVKRELIKFNGVPENKVNNFIKINTKELQKQNNLVSLIVKADLVDYFYAVFGSEEKVNLMKKSINSFLEWKKNKNKTIILRSLPNSVKDRIKIEFLEYYGFPKYYIKALIKTVSMKKLQSIIPIKVKNALRSKNYLRILKFFSPDLKLKGYKLIDFLTPEQKKLFIFD